MVGCAFHYKKKSIINPDEEEEEEGPQRDDEEAAAAPASSEGWVEVLVQSDFFGVCAKHREERKSEENIYCLDCSRRMCSHCRGGAHRGHRLLQIRRYVYQDVVRVHDMHSLLDCSKVQSYTVNSARVVLLKPRRKSNTRGTGCEICRRSISDYCSLSCLVSDVGAAAAAAATASSSAASVAPQGSSSEPFFPQQTADDDAVVESEGPSGSPASLHPSDLEQADVDRSILEPSKRRVHRKAAVPRRSPLL